MAGCMVEPDDEWVPELITEDIWPILLCDGLTLIPARRSNDIHYDLLIEHLYFLISDIRNCVEITFPSQTSKVQLWKFG